MELIDLHHALVERRSRSARFPDTKSPDTFNLPAIPSVDRALVMQFARCECIERLDIVASVH